MQAINTSLLVRKGVQCMHLIHIWASCVNVRLTRIWLLLHVQASDNAALFLYDNMLRNC